jgi:glucose-1-phosphatase
VPADHPTDGGVVRALLFDLGGVVIDIDFERAIHFWARRASCDATALAARFTFDEAYEQHERGELDAAGYFDALRRCLDVRLSHEDLATGWNEIYVGPVPGMATLLSVARRAFPLFAFTNSNPTHQSVWAVRFARELSIFRSVFVSSDLGLRKPDPQAFTTVAGLAGFEPSELCFFDDSAVNVEGARAAGMQAVLVESTNDVRRALQGLGLGIDGSADVER